MIEQTKGCVSISLYGSGAKYALGALKNVALAAEHYPGWECRIYLEEGHYAANALMRAGANVISMPKLPGSGGMFWRFLAVDDARFSHVIIRDSDSRITDREAKCVEEWIASDKPLHVIRDHPAHIKRPMIGGAVGLKTGMVQMTREIATWHHRYTYGDDEDFLASRIWPNFDHPKAFIRHCFTPSVDDLPFPPHSQSPNHVCAQIPLTVDLNCKWKAVVISPPHYESRRKRFFERLEKSGSFLAGNVEWVRGVVPGDCPPPPNSYPHQDDHPHYYYATKSHIDTIRAGIDSDLDMLFVFEDDATFHPEFNEQLTRTLMCVPEDWLAIQLGGQRWTDHKRDWVRDGSTVIYPNALAHVRGCLGMHGVLWSRRGMEEAIKYYSARPNAIIDWDFAKWQESEAVGFYSASRWIVEIDESTPQDGKDS